MNTIKYLKYLAVSLLLVAGFASCSDDDNLGDAPRLFRPIAKLTQDGTRNNLKATWTRLGGATGYQYELYQLVTDSTEITDGLQPLFTDTIEDTEIMFTSLSWDERYILKIRSVGSNIEASQYYETDYTTLSYPTALNTVRTIDNAALVTWVDPTTRGQELYTMFVVTGEDGTVLEYEVTDEENAELQKTIEGLSPETTYTLRAYYGDEQTVTTYQGRQVFTTRAEEDYDAEYGSNRIDLRDMDVDALDNIMDMINDGGAVILKGGAKYSLNGTTFDKSVIIRTGLSLEGNAIIVVEGAINAPGGTTIDKWHFIELDFVYKDINSAGFATSPIEFMKQSGFNANMGGGQVINLDQVGSTINEVIFEDCNITYFRGVVRIKDENNLTITSVSFNKCTLDGIGSQGIVTTDNRSTNAISNVSFEDCTLSNVIILVDFRSNRLGKANTTITDCTFCYASHPGTTQMMRLAESDVVTIQNTIFGPSIGENNYEAGESSALRSSGVVSASNSYKTNFEYSSSNYGIDGLNSLNGTDTDVFEDPTNGNFTLIDSSISRSVGATKWRAE